MVLWGQSLCCSMLEETTTSLMNFRMWQPPEKHLEGQHPCSSQICLTQKTITSFFCLQIHLFSICFINPKIYEVTKYVKTQDCVRFIIQEAKRPFFALTVWQGKTLQSTWAMCCALGWCPVVVNVLSLIHCILTEGISLWGLGEKPCNHWDVRLLSPPQQTNK